MKPNRLLSLFVAFSILSGIILVGCGSNQNEIAHNHHMAPLEDMPHEVQSAPVRTQEAYQFAVANPEMADAIPCYCGCGGMGHTSSYDCYVAGVDEAGVMQFDNHAQFCSICIDITHDTMRMMDEGMSTAEIFAQIEHDYSRFAPPTVKLETSES
jgi:hypothetical protein